MVQSKFTIGTVLLISRPRVQTGQGWYGAARKQTDDAEAIASGDTEGGGDGMMEGGGRRQGGYRDGISGIAKDPGKVG